MSRAAETVLVMMGVSGSGKTTVGERLARRLGWSFKEGDGLHPPAQVAKMKAGQPLTDDDRALAGGRRELVDARRRAAVSSAIRRSA